jgi:bacillolysin
MRQMFTLLFVLCSFLVLNAQSPLHPDFAQSWENNNWIKMQPDVRVAPGNFFNTYKSFLGFSDQHELVVYRVDMDNLGFAHHRAKQYVKGFPVDGAEFILHEKGGRVAHANGRLVHGNMPDPVVQVNKDEAIQLALDYLDAPYYLWERAGMEALVKRIKKDPNASFYPKPELVWANPDYTQNAENYQLAWKMEVYAADPVGTKDVFVDAANGNILYTLEKCQHTSVEGTAETRYHGTRQIITDSIAPDQFLLRDYTRGGGIETYDMNEETDIDLAVDFVDDDNYWDETANFDDAANDVHWGMEMTYDYFFQEHDRDSYDDEGSTIISYVHYNDGWFNASWNGMFSRFGDGNGNPLTSIDVVSHELTHGVTGNSAGLIYRNESGALNESFSDVFGNAVEYFALGDEADWLIGKVNFTLRSMSNPNAYGDPDTYKGTNWMTGTGDNGGVHTNSGVQNYWFYLMVEGGSGTNDNGDDFELQGLGWEKSGAIAYRNLNYYLTPSSNHFDARVGALLSAEDLYGSCSPEVEEVAKAWHAVGVGASTVSKDLEILSVSAPVSGCLEGASEEVTLSFKLNYSGCSYEMDPGTIVKAGYRVNGENPVLEDVVLANGLQEGGEFTYTFDQLVDLGESGGYSLDLWVNFGEDENALNDTLFNYLVRHPETINSERIITFELSNDAISEDSFYIQTGSRAYGELELSFGASEGIRYAKLSGSSINGPNDIDFATVPEEVFSLNPEFNSRICSCVDLPDNWQEAYLDFDLQQTWSTIYEDFGNQTSNLLVGLRVLIDEQQVGPSFHPTEHITATWETKTIDLTDFIGTSFELCLEGKHFFDSDGDPNNNSYGDNSNIDQVHIYGFDPLSVDETLDSDQLSVLPNPSSGQFLLDLPEALSGELQIRITDALGKTLAYREIEQAAGMQLPFTLENAAPGLYLLSIQAGDEIWTKKLIIE